MSRSRSWAANARVRRAGRSSSGQPTGSSASGSSPDHVQQLADDQILLRAGEQPGRRLAALGGGPAQQPEGVRREGAYQRLAQHPVAVAGDPAPRCGGAARWRARRPKVSTRIRSGSTPSATRAATASTRVLVLPVPGPPSTSIGPAVCAITCAWAGSACQPRAGAAAAGPADQPVRLHADSISVTPGDGHRPRPGTCHASAPRPSRRAGRRTNRYACISSAHQPVDTHPPPYYRRRPRAPLTAAGRTAGRRRGDARSGALPEVQGGRHGGGDGRAGPAPGSRNCRPR